LNGIAAGVVQGTLLRHQLPRRIRALAVEIAAHQSFGDGSLIFPAHR